MEYDFKTPNDVAEFESRMARQASKISKLDEKKLKKALADKKASEKKPPTNQLSMADRYKLAQAKVYSELPTWKQKEIDTQIKSDRLSSSRVYDEFIQQVAALAESDGLQAA